MHVIEPATLSPAAVAGFRDLIGPDRTARMRDAARRLRRRLGDGVLWHVNSTEVGGGVAEMLHVLVPFYRALEVPTRWAVVDGDEEFFDLTKRLGNLAYGSTVDADRLRPGDLERYLGHLAAEAERLRAVLGPADVVLCHDHQTAGLVRMLVDTVSAVHWRSHVGVDVPTRGSREAWAAMAPLLADAASVVFSVSGHVPSELAAHRTVIIPPVIWPFAPKHQPLADDVLPGLLDRCGLGQGSVVPPYVVADRPRDPDAPLVVQVSRWDRLKDMHAVLTSVVPRVPEAELALVGPDPAAIPDDTEQARWFAECHDAWRELPAPQRARARLVCLPMDDVQDNARLVNAAQRAADVVVQKSLAEGFGLTVTEAMWKGRAVVGSAVGGIASQIQHGHNGLLLDDPRDLAGCAALVRQVVDGSVDGPALGRRAAEDVRDRYLPDSDLLAVARLLGA